MTEAIIGLVGVLLGGLISGGAAYILAKRADQARLRAAARLVELELVAAQSALNGRLHVIRNTLSHQGWDKIRPRGREFSVSHWLEHRGTLAAALSPGDWYAVQRAFAALDAQNNTLRREQAGDRSMESPAADKLFIADEGAPLWVKVLHSATTEAEEAILALGDLSGRTKTDQEPYRPIESWEELFGRLRTRTYRAGIPVATRASSRKPRNPSGKRETPPRS
jgi:hypothetical protein